MNGKYYIGVTNDVERRLQEHNGGTVKSTSPYRPWLLRKTEKYNSINEAYKRERFIKAKHSRKIVEKIILS